jgi:hypothetical protein
VAAVAGAAAIVVTAATAGKFPHLSLSCSLTSGALLLRPESFVLERQLPHKIHSPAEFVLANPRPCV